MAVVYWQASIAATITVAFWLGRRFRGVGRVRPAWWLPAIVLFWVVWTFSNVFSPNLLAVQLVVVVGTFFVNAHFARQIDAKRAESLRADDASKRELEEKRRAEELAARVASLEEELTVKEQELLKRVPKDAWRFLSTEVEHRQALSEQLDGATTRLLITSGWINDGVVTSGFIGALRRALARGVSIVIVFGYASKKERTPLDDRGRRALRALVELGNEPRSVGGGQLVLAYAPVHAKVVVRDRDVALVGSSNWLSNNNYVNAERTIEVRHPEFVDEIAKSTAAIAHQAAGGVIERLLRGEAV
jgi:phosphatidylserine/phosphatidylglycerophosphate/cardiolipin synthase-like enzyme